ncbi:MAG TPA: amidohydrolase, partial [Candidatus Obscuribacterales bacterium]
ARGFEADLIAWRRHLHQHPELSGEEAATAAFVAEQLQNLGLRPVTGYAGTHAVTALIEGAAAGPCVALRADMDALPIQELNQHAYCSSRPGVMHACGHDAHTTMLLGAARLLMARRQNLAGSIRLIFQPAEERSDGDGAEALVRAGILAYPPVAAIFALHVFPELPAGTLGTRSGPILASADRFLVTLYGRGAHAARPHQGIDPILMAAQAVSALHHLVSRRIDPLSPAVLTIGWIRGGATENVIPEKVCFGGTVRTLDPDLREQIPGWIRQTLDGIAAAHGGRAELEYELGSAPVVNEAGATAFSFKVLDQLLGPDQVVRLPEPSMGGEDFGAYLEQVPGCFIRIGTRPPAQQSAPSLHSPHFDIDESILALGSAALAALATEQLTVNS